MTSHFVDLNATAGWTKRLPKLFPGAHVVASGWPSENVAIEARLAGFHLRDSLAILRDGPRVDVAFLFRAPLEGGVIDTVLRYGSGALNIEETRVACDLSEFFSKTGKPRSGLGHAHGFGMGDGYGGDRANPPHAKGRWPSNLVIVHGPSCTRLGTKAVKAAPAWNDNRGPSSFTGSYTSPVHHAEGDGTERVPSWSCPTTCSAWLLDAQSGDSRSRIGKPRGSSEPGQGWGMTKTGAEYDDAGGASRFFPQFASHDELVAWVERLIG